MQDRGRTGCGCVPGEVCCEEATKASRRLRDELPSALKTGDWREFDRVRDWLREHHFGRLKRTGTNGLG
jgi:hypothetical protein